MTTHSPASLYLDLIERCLTRLLHPDEVWPWEFSHKATFVREARELGQDWPTEAETMIGLKRLHHLRECAETVLREEVPGDFLEAGVWRGGAAILLRAVLAAYGEQIRQIWVADSFAGLPPPDAQRYPADAEDVHHTFALYLAVRLDQVQANFARYGLLDEQVRFLPGWFSETLAKAPVESLAVLRVDADMYGSTIEVLEALYDKVSPGGFVVVDDYGNEPTPGCRKAVDDFRRQRRIVEPIEAIDWTGVFWKKRRSEHASSQGGQQGWDRAVT